MNVSRWLAALGRILSGLVSSPFARGRWCRKQRLHLRVPGHAVVWVRGQAVPWAEWGARRGFFEVHRMDGLPYLRALGAST